MKINQTITADYDLLVVCPANDDLDLHGKDKTPFSTKGQLHHIQSIIRASASPFYLCPKEDPEMGNVSKRIRDIVKALNEAIAKLDPNRAGANLRNFHHNARWLDPTAEEVSYPLMFIRPKQMNSAVQSVGARFFGMKDSSIMLVESPQELRQTISNIEAKNYHWPTHSRLDVNVFEDEMVHGLV